jgi:outer membrane protein
MKALFVAPVLTLALAAAPAPARAQAATGQKPAQPAPTQPSPAQPAPAQPLPAQPAQPAPPPTPPKPFPEGAKVAFINIQRIANESSEGRAATAKVKALNDKKVAELSDKNKSLQAAQQKLQQSGSVLSDAARGQLEKDVEKLQVEIQRYTQDAQAEVQELQQELQAEFQKKLLPIINAVATERSLHMVFSQVDSGIVWADGGLDITNEIIKRFDTTGATATPKPQGQ